MPAAFDKCVKDGGKVRTIVPKKGRYFKICILNGKTYKGHMKKSKKK